MCVCSAGVHPFLFLLILHVVLCVSLCMYFLIAVSFCKLIAVVLRWQKLAGSSILTKVAAPHITIITPLVCHGKFVNSTFSKPLAICAPPGCWSPSFHLLPSHLAPACWFVCVWGRARDVYAHSVLWFWALNIISRWFELESWYRWCPEESKSHSHFWQAYVIEVGQGYSFIAYLRKLYSIPGCSSKTPSAQTEEQ